MAYFGSSLSKGMRDVLGKTITVFGAPFGSIDLTGWMSPISAHPEAEYTYDLTGFLPNHEVLVAITTLFKATAGSYTFKFSWIRGTEISPFFEYTYTVNSLEGFDTSVVSWVGYSTAEIRDNGDYKVMVEVSGPVAYNIIIPFAITGATPLTPPPDGSANLSGIVSDSQTGLPIQGAGVSTIYGQILTGVDGFYQFAGISAGRYLIEVTKTGYNYASIERELVAGENIQDFQLEPTIVPPNVGSLLGIVTNPATGAAIAAARLTLMPNPSNIPDAISRTDGTYDFQEIPVGVYQVQCSKDGFTSITTQKDINPGTNTLNFALVSTAQPPPSGGESKGILPWVLAGAGVLVGVVLLSRRKK